MILVSATARMGRTPVRRREQAVNPPPAQLLPEKALQGIGLEQSARFGLACDAIGQPEPDLELDRSLFRLAGHHQILSHPCARYSIHSSARPLSQD